MKNNMKHIKQFLLLSLFICLGFASSYAQGYTLPKYEKFTLQNGLTIYLSEQKDVPVISLSAIFPAGAIYDAGKSGLASLTATALKHGTKSYTKVKLDETLDFNAAYINTYASKESAGLSAKFAAKDLTLIMGMVKEVLLDPIFDASEFDKEKKKLLQQLDQQKESPRSIMPAYFDKFMYGSHVYGNVIQGNKTTVSKLTVLDVKNFYKENYLPEGSAIALVGDFTIAEMKTKLTALFSGWKKSTKPQVNLAAKPIAPQNANRVLLINKEDAKETTFYIGAPGISRNNSDYVAIDVVNTLFGGRFTSMLNDELRVNSGLTYGASSRFGALKNAGTFVISTFTAQKTTEAAIDKALEVLDNLHKKGFDETALASAKNYVKGQFPPRYETASQLSGLLTQMFWYGFDESFINNFEKNVDGLTLQKAKQIIATYFPKDKLQFVMVGKAADIKKIVGKYGAITEAQIKEDIKN
jgi:zinc protease